MLHPIHFLQGRTLSAQQWQQLRENSSTHAPGPGPNETTFTFRKDDVNDSEDRVIVADSNSSTFRCLPRAKCVCQSWRPPLHCDCIELPCPECGALLMASDLTCEDQLCVNPTCPACEHYRETCAAEEIKEALIRDREKAIQESPDLPISQAYMAAISTNLAPGVGEAPLFPVTVRILNQLLASPDANEDTRQWACPDGSVVKEDPLYQGWLTSD